MPIGSGPSVACPLHCCGLYWGWPRCSCLAAWELWHVPWALQAWSTCEDSHSVFKASSMVSCWLSSVSLALEVLCCVAVFLLRIWSMYPLAPSQESHYTLQQFEVCICMLSVPILSMYSTNLNCSTNVLLAVLPNIVLTSIWHSLLGNLQEETCTTNWAQ